MLKLKIEKSIIFKAKKLACIANLANTLLVPLDYN